MSRTDMMQKLTFVVFGENSWRLAQLELSPDNRWRVVIDVHGLSVREAKKMLKNLIAVLPVGIELIVIHGYNHGTALKQLIRSEEMSSYRVLSVSSPAANPGISTMQISAMRGRAAG